MKNSLQNDKISAGIQRFKGELDSRGLPAQIHHSLKRMTMVSLGIDISVASLLVIMARKMSKGKGGPAATLYEECKVLDQ